MRTQKLVYRRQSLKLSRLRLVPIFLKDSRGSKTEHAWKLPHARKARRGGEREKWFEMKNEIKNHFSLSPPHLALLAWGDFHTHLPFAPSTIPEGKWGLLVVQSVVIQKKRLKRPAIWQMSFVTQLSKMINVKLGFETLSFHPQGDPVLNSLFFAQSLKLPRQYRPESKFVSVTPTQSCPQGFSPKKWVGRPTQFLRERPWGRGWLLQSSLIFFQLTFTILKTY